MSYFGRKVLFDGQLAFVNKENEDGSVNLFILGEHGQKLAHNQSPDALEFVATDTPPATDSNAKMLSGELQAPAKLTAKQALAKASKDAKEFRDSQAGKDAAIAAEVEARAFQDGQ